MRIVRRSALLGTLAAASLAAQLSPSEFAAQNPPLEIRQISVKSQPGVRVKDIRFNGIDGKPISAYIVEPAAKCGPRNRCAGVLFGHWYEPSAPNSDRSEFLPEAYDLARHGAVSVLVQGIWADNAWFQSRHPDDDYRVSIEQVKNLRRALDILLRQPGIDTARVACVGHDFGMMFGTILAGIDRRIRMSVLMAGTTCLSDWYLIGAKVKPEQQRKVEAKLKPLCPALYLPRATGPVLLQFGNNDPYVSLKNARALADAAPEPKRVRFYDAGHELNGAARVDRLQWLALRLRLRPEREE